LFLGFAYFLNIGRFEEGISNGSEAQILSHLAVPLYGIDSTID